MFYYLKYFSNLDNWTKKEDIDRRCSLCYGGPHILNYSHVSNAIHRSNVERLGNLEWWKIPEDTLFSYLHDKKTTNKGLKKKKND